MNRANLRGVMVLLLCFLWLATAWWTHKNFLPYDVNNTDIGTYLFQAETFAEGKIIRSTPEPREFFQQWQAIVRDHSYAYYPPVHALFLAIPLVLGLHPWIIPWLLSGLSLILVYCWGSRVGSSRSALFATFAIALSPFFAANAPSLLSHSTTLFLTLLFLWLASRWQQNGSAKDALGVGVVLALIFGTRIVNAAALGVVWIPWIFLNRIRLRQGYGGPPLRGWVEGATLASPKPSAERGPSEPQGKKAPTEVSLPRYGLGLERLQLKEWGAFLIGLIVVIVPLVAYYRILGGRWRLDLFTDYWPRNRFGLGQGLGRGEPGHFFQTYTNHDWTGVITNLKYSFLGLCQWWTGNIYVSVFLLAVGIGFFVYIFYLHPVGGLVESARTHWIRLQYLPLAIWPLVHVLFYAFYYTPSTPFSGPRYLTETSPALALGTGWIFARLSMMRRVRWGLAILIPMLIWISVDFKKTFYFDNARGIPSRRQVEECVLKGVRAPAIVFLRSFWLGHPYPIFLNRADLKGPIIYACDRGAEDKNLVSLYPDRNAYILLVSPLKGGSIHSELIQIYDGNTYQWITEPEEILAPFFIGRLFTPAIKLQGEICSKLFAPKPDEIPNQAETTNSKEIIESVLDTNS